MLSGLRIASRRAARPAWGGGIDFSVLTRQHVNKLNSNIENSVKRLDGVHKEGGIERGGGGGGGAGGDAVAVTDVD